MHPSQNGNPGHLMITLNNYFLFLYIIQMQFNYKIWFFILAVSAMALLVRTVISWQTFKAMESEIVAREDKINEIKEKTCFEEFDRLENIKQEHEKSKKRTRGRYEVAWWLEFDMKFEKKSDVVQKGLEKAYQEIELWEKEVSDREKESNKVRNTIAHCDKLYE